MNLDEKGSSPIYFGKSSKVDTGSQAKPNSAAVQGTSATSTRVPGTSEILFLKRLLFLKASIDNESTLNTFSVPFEQEKARDIASPDQLMIDTHAVLSGRGSMGLDSYARD